MIYDICQRWVELWNHRDLDGIMEYYADDAVLYSRYVTERWKVESGKLSGKEKIREHFKKAFESNTSLELTEMLESPGSILLIYSSRAGAVSADLVELNESQKVTCVRSFYPPASS